MVQNDPPLEPYQPIYPGEFDESELEEKDPFDWQSLKAVCIGTAPQHPAYGMSFEDYARKRGDYTDDDGHPTSAMTFRLPPYPAFVLPSFSRRRREQTGESLYRYMIITLEMGLIKFQHDYHDTYAMINASTDIMVATTPEKFQEHKWLCINVGDQKINLGTSSRTNTAFAPHVAYWLSSAVKQVCGDLKMTQSDLIALCMFIGILEDSKTLPIPEPVLSEFTEFIQKFEFHLSLKSKAIASAKSTYCEDVAQ